MTDKWQDYVVSGKRIIKNDPLFLLSQPRMKQWYASKTIWFNLIMTVVGTAAAVQTVYTQLSDQSIMALVLTQTMGNLILRIWFTDSKIEEL